MEEPFEAVRASFPAFGAVCQLPDSGLRVKDSAPQFHAVDGGHSPGYAIFIPAVAFRVGNARPAEKSFWIALMNAVHHHCVVGVSQAEMSAPFSGIHVGAGVDKQGLSVDPQHKTEQVAMRVSAIPCAAQPKRAAAEVRHIGIRRP